MTSTTSRRRPLLINCGNPILTTILCASTVWFASACTTNNYYDQFFIDPVSDAGDSPGQPGPTTPNDGGTDPAPVDAGEGSDGGSAAPVSPGAPLATTDAESIQLDVLNAIGNHYWLVVSDEQLERMNAPYAPGGPIFLMNNYGDIYTPGGVDTEPTFVDHFLVTNTATPTASADFGKVQVRLVGQSTGREWSKQTLPNFKIDSDEFQDGLRIDGVKHIRFNNAVVGGIYREKLTLDLYRRLGYPAPKATYAWVSNNVWGPDIKVPYVVVESYKPQFCKAREKQLGGECPNMWELSGDFGYGAFQEPNACQFSECDSSRVDELDQAVALAPTGEGFKSALAQWLDWDAFHRFQCLSWVLETGDDAIHNSNNLVLAERADGKFQLLPYSVDISLGQDWYTNVPLAGNSSLARGCQADPQCWADTISTCEKVLKKFTEADPVAMLDEQHAALETAGMLRAGDDDRYESLRGYLQRRLEQLPIELELNRESPDTGVQCESPMVDCGGYCAYPEDCVVCEPGPAAIDPRPLEVARVAADPLMPPRPDLPGADGGVADGSAADVILNPEPLPGEDPVDEPVPVPGGCLPMIDKYAL